MLDIRTIIEEHFYDTEEEREEHVAQMEQDGWKCSGQDMKSKSGNPYNLDFCSYGKFFKYEK